MISDAATKFGHKEPKELYTSHLTTIDSKLNDLRWKMRDRRPNAEVVEIARDVQSAMIRLQEYIVRHYEGR